MAFVGVKVNIVPDRTGVDWSCLDRGNSADGYTQETRVHFDVSEAKAEEIARECVRAIFEARKAAGIAADFKAAARIAMSIVHEVWRQVR